MSAIVLSREEDGNLRHATSELARKLVARCMTDPSKYLKNPMTVLCAEYLFENHALHQCYWNDRFCIAVMCGLWSNRQRLAAWCVVSNGLNLYWEWRTHSGYDMAA